MQLACLQAGPGHGTCGRRALRRRTLLSRPPHCAGVFSGYPAGCRRSARAAALVPPPPVPECNDTLGLAFDCASNETYSNKVQCVNGRCDWNDGNVYCPPVRRGARGEQAGAARS